MLNDTVGNFSVRADGKGECDVSLDVSSLRGCRIVIVGYPLRRGNDRQCSTKINIDGHASRLEFKMDRVTADHRSAVDRAGRLVADFRPDLRAKILPHFVGYRRDTLPAVGDAAVRCDIKVQGCDALSGPRWQFAWIDPS